MHPWNKANIDAEREIVKEYSLKNKREIFIANSLLKKYKNIAKKLIAKKTEQGEKEKQQVLRKLHDLGLISAGAELDTILGLELKDLLERRLQSIVFRKGMSRTMRQARQFIVHRHIAVGDKEISMPSYLVSLEEENLLKFKDRSALSDEEHPERSNEKAAEAKEEKDESKKEVKETKEIKKEKSKKPVMKNIDAEEEVTSEIEEELSGEDGSQEISPEVKEEKPSEGTQ